MLGKFTNGTNDDRGVSPVIGVMVAVSLVALTTV